MKKNSSIRKIISTHCFVLKLAWSISKKRVLLEFLHDTFMNIEELVFSVYFIKLMLDMVTQGVSFSRVMFFIWGIIGCAIVNRLQHQWFRNMVIPVTDVRFYDGINRLLYQKACHVDLQCFEDSEFYNQYMLAIRQAQTQIPNVLHNVSHGLTCFAASAASCVLIFYLDRYAVLLLVLPIFGNFIFNKLLIERVFQMDRDNIAFQRIADYVNRTIHLSDYAKEIRLSNVFRLLQKQYDRSVNSIHQTIDRYAPLNMLFYYLRQFLTFATLFEGGAIYAGYRVLVSGSMTFSAMAVFQGALCAAAWDILDCSEAMMQSVKDSLYIEQIQNFLEYEPKIPEDADGTVPVLPIRSIEFSHVWFGYKKGEWILKDISFQISPGQSTAIAGYNGAGKSTLIKLLLRFYDPDKGTILLNGTDIRSYHLKSYRALFSTAFQDGKIFADTVQENILMGRHGSKEEDTRIVWESLKLAGMAEEVSAFPQKEHTVLTREFSPDGLVLSGGQNQKIIAARAFAGNKPVAIFDEPSSALDPLAENELFQNIQDYSKDKILFFISHRLSSVQNADTVFFMEHGRITERGNHKELMRRNGSYASLYKIQAQNYQAHVKTTEDISCADDTAADYGYSPTQQ
ncbi:MAG: ABC transporter ATP-binding protein [Lachnospiraceae bacterium]|nr:ABC transporter ATP-binding protein [Lachnospiraceae bacterium]